MASNIYDLTIRAGDDHTFVVTWLPDGTATELTGATAEMAIVWSRYAGGSVSLTSAGGQITIDTGANTITVVLDEVTTAAIASVESQYQLRIDIGGVKTTIASGRVITQRNLIDG